MQLHGHHPQTIDGNWRRKLTENHLQVSKFPSWTNSAYHAAKKKKNLLHNELLLPIFKMIIQLLLETNPKPYKSIENWCT